MLKKRDKMVGDFLVYKWYKNDLFFNFTELEVDSYVL